MRTGRKLIVVCLLALSMLVVVRPSVGDAPSDAQKLFDSLFRPKIQAVAKTVDRSDDIALAKNLVETAANSSDQPEFAALLCHAAHNLGMRHPDGYATAAEAMRLLSRQDGPEREKAQEELIGTLTRMMRAGDAASRQAAAAELVDVYTTLGDDQYERNDFVEAAKTYRRALLVASRSLPEASAGLTAKMKAATARVQVGRSIDSLQQKLLENANDSASAEKLVLLYVVDLDSPEKALPYVKRVDDPQLAKMTTLAAESLIATTADQSLALGEWYQGLAKDASASSKTAMQIRAKGYLERFLKLHNKNDLSAKKAELVLKELQSQLDASPDAGSTTSSTASTQKKYQPPDGCVAYWSFDADTLFEKKGLYFFRNEIGDNNHLRVKNPKTIRGRYGDAFYFDGKDTHGVVEGNRTLDKYTIVLWVNAKSMQERNPIFLDAHRAGFNSHGRPDIRLTADGQVEGTGGWDGSKYNHIRTSQPVRPGSWNVVALTVDAPAKTITLIHNGKVVGTSTHYAEALFMKDNGNRTSRIEVGARIEKSWYFHGALDEMMIFDKVLSASDLKRVMTRR